VWPLLVNEYRQNDDTGSFVLFISDKVSIALITSRVEMLRNIKSQIYNDAYDDIIMVRHMGAGKYEGWQLRQLQKYGFLEKKL
jgi:hypothetical protein